MPPREEPFGQEGRRLSTEDLASPQEREAPWPATQEAEPDDTEHDTQAERVEEPERPSTEETPGLGQDQNATVPAAGPAVPSPTKAPDQETTEALLTGEELEGLRRRWGEIQTRFIDDPTEAVQAADQLVAEVMHKLAASFTAHKQGLQQQWQGGDEVATEDLRVALRQYRSFFNRLLGT